MSDLTQKEKGLAGLVEKWQPVLDSGKVEPIADDWRRKVTAQLLENESKYMKEEGLITEATPNNVTGGVAKFDPILLPLVRRMAPKLIGYEIAGVQPMTGPTGLIFALRSRYNNQAGDEALHDEANTAHSGVGSHAQTDPFDVAFDTGTGMPTATAEGDTWNKMAFTIEKVTATATARQLKAEYSVELAQDLRAIHGLDAQSEISDILTTEIIAEINREVVRTVYAIAKPGAAWATTPGTVDIPSDTDGRWAGERYKGLMMGIELEANAIATETRRGKGNVMICSANLASALAMAGVLDYSPAIQNNLTVDTTGSTFAGTLKGGSIRVFVDPYVTVDFFVLGYKGANKYDAGFFYCPYVPLQKLTATDTDSMQPVIGFKTRYALVSNPFSSLNANSNEYYRKVRVTNIL